MYLLASNTSWGMFGAGVLVLIVLLLRRSHRYLKRIKRENPASHRKLGDASQVTPLMNAPPEILRWQVEMHETARDLKAELDSKMVALQAIVRIASEASSRLEATIARAERLGISTCPDRLAAIGGVDGGVEPDERTLPESENANGDNFAETRDAVYELADQGLAATVIARSMGIPLGDVELLLSLRPAPNPPEL